MKKRGIKNIILVLAVALVILLGYEMHSFAKDLANSKELVGSVATVNPQMAIIAFLVVAVVGIGIYVKRNWGGKRKEHREA